MEVFYFEISFLSLLGDPVKLSKSPERSILTWDRVSTAFAKFDTDESGSLDRTEFTEAIHDNYLQSIPCPSILFLKAL